MVPHEELEIISAWTEPTQPHCAGLSVVPGRSHVNHLAEHTIIAAASPSGGTATGFLISGVLRTGKPTPQATGPSCVGVSGRSPCSWQRRLPPRWARGAGLEAIVRL